MQESVERMRAAVRSLAPLVAEHRSAIDRERRLPEPLFAALADLGLFRLWLPAAIGGPEFSPIEFMAIVEEAAALDGSIGWLVGNGSGMSRVAGYLPEDVARTWFVDPRAFIASATGALASAQPVDGGYRVSGRWPFGSGAPHATRFMGLCNVVDDDATPAKSICCYFARKDVSIVDNWHVSGLRGTGSCDFEVRDLFVPIEHTHGFADQPACQAGILYRMPNITVFSWTVSVVPLGIARSAMAATAELATRKGRAGAPPLRDRESAQSSFGRAAALHASARAFLIDAMIELMAATDIGGERLMRARATLRLACSHAAESAGRIVDAMAKIAGSAAIFETCALERCVRDVQAAVKHIAMGPSNYIVSGRLGFGMDPGTTRF